MEMFICKVPGMNDLFLQSLEQFLTHSLTICQEKGLLRAGEVGGTFIQSILPLPGLTTRQPPGELTDPNIPKQAPLLS